MKGLLVGVLFAIRGLFQFLNSIVIIPLSLKQPWASGEMIDHPSVAKRGFVYLMLTSVTGLIGLILLSLAAKNPHSHISGVMLYQLSYQAPWEQGGGTRLDALAIRPNSSRKS